MNLLRLAFVSTLATCLPAAPQTARGGDPAAKPQKAPTLRQILSSPLPSSLIAAPGKSRIAWVLNERGTYSIWGGEGKSVDGYTARRLHSYPGDSGRALTLIGFSPDSDTLVYARAGGANPTALAGGTPATTIHCLDWSGTRKPWQLDDAGAGVVSPTAATMAFARGGEVKVTDLRGVSRSVVKTRGAVSQLRWSPDGSTLVMTIKRTSFGIPYSWVATYKPGDPRLRYLDPSIHTDSQPRWSPDGKRIAFIRRHSRAAGSVLTARKFPRPDPWTIRVADLGSGETTAWTPRPEPHSSRHAAIRWRTADRLIYRSERSGWHRLYELGADRRARALSERGSEVEDFTIGPHGVVLFTSNAFDEDRRHLWRAEIDAPARLWTRGTSIEWGATPLPGTDLVAHLGSDARNPAMVGIRSIGGKFSKPLAVEAIPSDFPASALVVPSPVILTAADGRKIHAQLFKPPSRFEGRRPAVMFFHGGPMRQMLLGWHYRGYYHRAYGFNQYLANRGYCVLSVNFRLGIGYGREFRDVEDGGPRGASEYQDLLAGHAWLRRQQFVDAGRIGLWGGSYGGFMTALGLARNSDLFAAGVDFHGVHDWNLWQAWVRDKQGASKPGNNATAAASSPRADLDKWRSPVLLVHGDDDRNVPFAETIWLARELRRRRVDHEVLVIPDETHSFLRHQSWLRAFTTASDFLDRKLRDHATPDVKIAPGPHRYEVDLGSETIEVFTYKPRSYRGEKMIMVMHGTLRNADEYRDHAQAMGERFGALIVAPRFDRQRFPSRRYHHGGILERDRSAAPKTQWTYRMIPKLAAMVRAMEDRPKLPYWIIGHSAGGQFVARMSAFMDTGAERHVAANPGSHLFPRRDMNFAYGFGDLPAELSDSAALRRYLAAPLTFYLGTKDDKPDRYFNRSRTAMRQGPGRLQRGRNCFAAGQELANRHGWVFNWRLVDAPGVDHDHAKMFDHPRCAEALFGK